MDLQLIGKREDFRLRVMWVYISPISAALSRVIAAWHCSDVRAYAFSSELKLEKSQGQ